MEWGENTSEVIKKGRDPITLTRSYKVKWESYYESTKKNGKFKYSLLEVLPLGEKNECFK
jgi:hypothetical protein